MSIDKFGRSTSARSGVDVSSSHLLSSRRGFVFTEDGNIDIEELKLCNVQSPTEYGDAVNKKYVDDNIAPVILEFNSLRNDISQLTLDLTEQKTSLTVIEKTLEKLKTVVTAIDMNIASRSAIKVHADVPEVNLLE